MAVMISAQEACVHCGAARGSHDALNRCTTRLGAVVHGVTFRAKPFA